MNTMAGVYRTIGQIAPAEFARQHWLKHWLKREFSMENTLAVIPRLVTKAGPINSGGRLNSGPISIA
jgi:hypothetical protein